MQYELFFYAITIIDIMFFLEYIKSQSVSFSLVFLIIFFLIL